MLVVESSAGSAHDFHHRPLDDAGDRGAIWVHRVERPALVVGSSQRVDIVDVPAATASGWEVSGRRSGGGVVVVEPGASCWIDVVISRDHPRWSDDVNAAFGWIGHWWLDALESLGVTDLEVHGPSIVDREFGRAVCFAGLGPGEVARRVEGVPWKVVGLSQRRTRSHARFQGLYLERWNPEPIRAFVDPGIVPTGLDLDAVRAGFGDDAGPAPERVIEAFVQRAP